MHVRLGAAVIAADDEEIGKVNRLVIDRKTLQIIEVTDLGVRSAVIRLRRRGHARLDLTVRTRPTSGAATCTPLLLVGEDAGEHRRGQRLAGDRIDRCLVGPVGDGHVGAEGVQAELVAVLARGRARSDPRGHRAVGASGCLYKSLSDR